MLLLQPKQQVAPLLHGAQALGVRLDFARVRAGRLRQLGRAGKRRVQQLLPFAEGGIDAEQARQDLLRFAESRSVHGLFQLARQAAQLLGVREALRLDVQRFVLSELGLGAFDLLEHVPQIVGLATHVGLARRQLGLALAQIPQSQVRIPHRHALDVGVRVRIEHIALRVGAEQGLRLVLTMQVHQQRADFGEHPDGGG